MNERVGTVGYSRKEASVRVRIWHCKVGQVAQSVHGVVTCVVTLGGYQGATGEGGEKTEG